MQKTGVLYSVRVANWTHDTRNALNAPYVPIPARMRPTPPPGSVIGYTRVSTDEQVLSGLGLEAQRQTIARRAAVGGWIVAEWFTDEGISGKVPPLRRPGLHAAMRAMQKGTAERIVVAKLDRLGRDAARVLDLDTLAAQEGWGITMCDVDIDTSTAAGRFMLGNLANAAEFERNLISERTRAALAVKKAQGIRLGRPSKLPIEVVRRIVLARRDGAGYARIATDLNRDQVPTAHGARAWHPSTVRSVLAGQDATRLTGELS